MPDQSADYSGLQSCIFKTIAELEVVGINAELGLPQLTGILFLKMFADCFCQPIFRVLEEG